MQQTATEAWYYRLRNALEAQDLVTLESLYHPDATLISLKTGQIIQGRPAIMASITQTLALTSPIKLVDTQSLVTYSDAVVCVEATQSTRFTHDHHQQTYDIYVLETGVIRNHFSGMIAPRQVGSSFQLDTPTTPEQRLYSSYWSAIREQRYGQLRGLYHPDATSISVSTNSITQGSSNIVHNHQREISEIGPRHLKALTRFIEDTNLICAEGIFTIYIDPGMSLQRVPLDVQFYAILLLQAGLICVRFGGLISPRPAELHEILRRSLERRIRGSRTILDTYIASQRPWWH